MRVRQSTIRPLKSGAVDVEVVCILCVSQVPYLTLKLWHLWCGVIRSVLHWWQSQYGNEFLLGLFSPGLEKYPSRHQNHGGKDDLQADLPALSRCIPSAVALPLATLGAENRWPSKSDVHQENDENSKARLAVQSLRMWYPNHLWHHKGAVKTRGKVLSSAPLGHSEYQGRIYYGSCSTRHAVKKQNRRQSLEDWSRALWQALDPYSCLADRTSSGIMVLYSVVLMHGLSGSAGASSGGNVSPCETLERVVYRTGGVALRQGTKSGSGNEIFSLQVAGDWKVTWATCLNWARSGHRLYSGAAEQQSRIANRRWTIGGWSGQRRYSTSHRCTSPLRRVGALNSSFGNAGVTGTRKWRRACDCSRGERQSIKATRDGVPRRNAGNTANEASSQTSTLGCMPQPSLRDSGNVPSGTESAEENTSTELKSWYGGRVPVSGLRHPAYLSMQEGCPVPPGAEKEIKNRPLPLAILFCRKAEIFTCQVRFRDLLAETFPPGLKSGVAVWRAANIFHNPKGGVRTGWAGAWLEAGKYTDGRRSNRKGGLEKTGRYTIDVFRRCVNSVLRIMDRNTRDGATTKISICYSVLEEKKEELRLLLRIALGTEDAEKKVEVLNVNSAAVSGMMSTGGGYSQLEELCGALNMPCISKETWKVNNNRISDEIHKSAWELIAKAAPEEVRLAMQAGDVDKEGRPMISIVTDGAWSKRSYKTKYNSLSGRRKTRNAEKQHWKTGGAKLGTHGPSSKTPNWKWKQSDEKVGRKLGGGQKQRRIETEISRPGSSNVAARCLRGPTRVQGKSFSKCVTERRDCPHSHAKNEVWKGGSDGREIQYIAKAAAYTSQARNERTKTAWKALASFETDFFQSTKLKQNDLRLSEGKYNKGKLVSIELLAAQFGQPAQSGKTSQNGVVALFGKHVAYVASSFALIIRAGIFVGNRFFDSFARTVIMQIKCLDSCSLWKTFYDLAQVVTNDLPKRNLFVATSRDLPKVHENFDADYVTVELAAAETANESVAVDLEAHTARLADFEEKYFLVMATVDAMTGDSKASGDPKQWPNFSNLFATLVKNNDDLSPVEKLAYMKTALHDEPHGMIQLLPISDANFEVAWKLLVDRYENKRLLVSVHVEASLQGLSASVNSPTLLRHLSCILNENVSAPNTLDVPVDQWDLILLLIVCKRLDTTLQTQWEMTLGTELPTLKDLPAFLENHCRAQEAVSSSTAKRSVHGGCCLFTEIHKLYKCPEFVHQNPKERFSLVKQHKLCFNCLLPSHCSYNSPSSSSCHQCGARHHTLLHFEQNGVENKSPDKSEAASAQSSEPQSSVVLSAVTLDVCSWSAFGHSQPGEFHQTCLAQQRTHLPIHGLSNTQVNVAKSFTPVVITPRDAPDVKLSQEVHSSVALLKLADPSFETPGPVDLLIGADLLPRILTGGKIDGSPMALDSVLGWIFMGQSPLEDIMRRFWEFEKFPPTKHRSPYEVICEDLFVVTHSRNEAGRYIVSLPFHSMEPELGSSRPQAFNRMFHLEKHFNGDPPLKQRYNEFMQDYLALGHMEKVPESQLFSSAAYYIPHHCVIKPETSTTQLCVVFDASSRSSIGVSLNDTLLTGPSLQCDIVEVLLNQLAEDERGRFPAAASVLQTDMYVDGVATGSSSVESALALQQELIALLAAWRFKLRKFVSAHRALLDWLPVDDVLGLQWDPLADVFSYKTQTNSKRATKRNILSDIARIFDPLGWLSPLSMFSQHLIQLLSFKNLYWDESPTDIVEKKITGPNGSTYELHDFCDSSEIGYAAVIYLCIINRDDIIVTHLLAGKSKVVPVKTQSCLTDSQVILSWIGTSPHQLKTFVANRVSEIQELTRSSWWRHVPSECNPVDCASHGILPAQLINHSLLWTGNLSPQEWENAFKVLLLHVKSIAFQNELAALSKGQYSSTRIRKLSPFIDKAGLPRVGGRLHNSDLPFEQKHPALLPKSHPLTSLIIRHYQNTNHHPGLHTLQGILWKQFWILSDRHATSRLLHHCMQCWKARPSSCMTVMGNLPAMRVQQHTNVSLHAEAGHLICIVTAGQTLLGTTTTWLTYSNSLCHILTRNQLLIGQLILASPDISILQLCRTLVIDEQILTFEELYKVVVQVKAVLNSRPLCPLSSDVNGSCALAPGNFLMLEPLATVSEPDLGEVKWHRDYLHTLQQRSKWQHQGPQHSPNKLVLIKEDRLPLFSGALDGLLSSTQEVMGLHEWLQCELPMDLHEAGLFDHGLLATLHAAENFWPLRLANLLNQETPHSIIRYKTKKVLFICTRNKYCTVCARYSATGSGISIPAHKCAKNLSGSSITMEQDVIVEGFPQSLSMHGLIYSQLIADGDIIVHRKLINAILYGQMRQVEEIECRNHICRNYSNKVGYACANTKFGNHELHSAIQARSMQLRTVVTSAIKSRKKQSEKDYYLAVEELRKDIRVANNATSLILDVDNNIAENHNSVVAKFVGGKRVNFAMGSSLKQDKGFPFFAASPDGLVGDIIEVKFPSSAKTMLSMDAIGKGKINVMEIQNDKLRLKVSHYYMYQVQGLLHISRRNTCNIVVWASHSMISMQIRDKEFWENKMLGKLETFFNHCLLLEIIDPKHSWNMPIREHKHIKEAQIAHSKTKKLDISKEDQNTRTIPTEKRLM
ncbi:hypothetical protein PR048_008913 [Dryococelus australis]|uniref:Uncharacterized protein n=1 Tax=Dryococelus australis TaxID=614101 RepID=A0ABQ9HYG7_9NEOP|nr:hypothetical protein PR048_008913 [Dryococelus australis]